MKRLIAAIGIAMLLSGCAGVMNTLDFINAVIPDDVCYQDGQTVEHCDFLGQNCQKETEKVVVPCPY